MRQPPRDHVPVTPDRSVARPCRTGFALALAGGWIVLALASAFLAFGV
ncbi:hypothetical protein [Shinella zoogloeoides]|nr:hypothetical protein [Shinella zoogloeoides]